MIEYPQNSKFEVYQLQIENEVYEKTEDGFVKDGTHFYDLKFKKIADYEITKDCKDITTIFEEIWNSLNAICWQGENYEQTKPVVDDHTITKPTINSMGYCNSDIIITSPNGKIWEDSRGWSESPTFEEAVFRIIYRYCPIQWNKIRNKSDFDEEKFLEFIKTRNKKNKIFNYGK